MKVIFRHKFIKANIGSWPLILGLAFFFLTHISSAEEIIDEQVYSNLTEQELEAATVNLVLALETLLPFDFLFVSILVKCIPLTP